MPNDKQKQKKDIHFTLSSGKAAKPANLTDKKAGITPDYLGDFRAEKDPRRAMKILENFSRSF